MNLGRKLKPSEISAYWYRQGFDFILHHPGDFIRLDFKKLYYSWNAYEIQSNRDIYSQREYSSLFRILLWHNVIGFPFGILAPLAIAGLFIIFRIWKSKYFLLLGILLVFQIILIAFFVTSRFRAPMLPYLIILAAIAIDYVIRNARTKSKLLMPTIAIIVFLFVCNSTLFGVKPMEQSRNYQARASIFLRENQLDSAIVYGRMAVNDNPNDPAGYDFLGTAYELSKDYAQAAEAYRKAVTLSPEDAFAYNHLGYSLYKLGKFREAAQACSQALQIDSSIIEAYSYLGTIYNELGKPDSALQIMEKGYKIDSSDIPLLNNYAVILREEGDYGKAIRVLERVVTLMPEYLPAHTNLANLYFQSGNFQQAESQYLAALKIDPDELQTNLNLAQLYLRTGRKQQGIEILNRVLEKYPDNPTAKKLLDMARSIPQ
jgi:tetratricopeptide (TPR) repeat protein